MGGAMATRLLLLAYLAPTLLLWAGPSAMMLVIAETAAGRTFALGSLLLWAVVPVLLAGAARRAAACFGLAFAALGLCAAWAPRPEPPPAVGPASIFRGEPGYGVWNPASLVPEIDQFKLGSFLAPFADPLIDRPQAARLRTHFMGVYREMGADPAFARLTSVMPYAYGEIFMGAPQPDHAFTYVPATAQGKLPVLLFLHGWGGNFQGYMWTLKEAADAAGVAIVAPSHGAGVWDEDDAPGRPGGLTRIRAALATIRAHPRMDAGRVTLMGLSNGGVGVSEAAIALPDQLRQLVYISPVIEPWVVGDAAFTRAWRGRPVHLLHGADDNRIPLAVVKEAEAAMRAGGVDVDLAVFPGEEHWLCFSRRHEIARMLAPWLRRAR